MSEQYGVKDMVFPLVVIDISEKVKEDVEYAVTVEDIREFEAAYGDIPDGAFCGPLYRLEQAVAGYGRYFKF